MKAFLIVLFLIALAIMVAIFLHQDAGSVQVFFNGSEFSAPLLHVFVGGIVGFFALYILLRFLGMLFRAPSSLSKAKDRRAIDSASQRLVTGTLDLSEGHFSRAEKQLTKDVPSGSSGALHYLAAAKAAHGLGKAEYQEFYLKEALKHHPAAKFAIDLESAQSSLDAGETDAALAMSQSLVKTQMRNPRALTLLAQSLAATGNWEELNGKMAELHKYSSLSKDQLSALESQAAAGLLAAAEESQLESTWKSIAAEPREEPAIVKAYANRLQAAGKGDVAERILRTSMDNNWDDSLVATYGAIEATNPEQQMTQLQTWIDKHGESADLLAAAGQVSVRQELWGKAHSYLEQAAKLDDSAAIQQALAKIAENKGDAEASRLHLERGLQLALSH